MKSACGEVLVFLLVLGKKLLGSRTRTRDEDEEEKKEYTWTPRN